MEADRYFTASLCRKLNSPDTSAIILEVLGHQLHFAQDPNSKHLGTTVWDASMVFAKFLEKNCRKGRFSPSKLKGKRVIELGAGCGVAGFGVALLGCDVISTDQTEVLPLLMRNVERNTSRILQMNPNSDSFGSIQVAELNWGNTDHIRAVDPPFDYIIGTDVMHSEYQHPSIQLFMMSLKPSDCKSNDIDGHVEDVKSDKTKQILEEDDGSNCVVNEVNDRKGDQTEEGSTVVVDLQNKKISDWEARRYGAMAARLLRDVKIN
ncbi:hypothetical protein DH2020_024516 [Rehmannia glutinosa]|uniref:Uncharacterized protein n=1 Tax=Rehmannia glutinosa TaxID=99300 RepID=A0ABR0W648_REHGL